MKRISVFPATGARAVARLALAASLATGLLTTTANAAPFSNGSFETPVLGGVSAPSFQTIPTNGTIGAWAVVLGNVDVVGTFWDAADGAQSIDLNGQEPGAICQAFDTLAGTDYTLNFALSRNGATGVSPASATLGVFVDGNLLGTFTHNAPWTQTDPAWESKEVSFTPTTAATVVCFSSLAPTSGDGGPAIDSVTLSVAPQNACTDEQTIATQRHWYFGQRAVLDFGVNGSPPISSLNSVNGIIPEGSAVITDTSGNLLFYTDGLSVRDRNNNVMPNGTGLGGSNSATQTALAFPSLTQPGIYFVVGNNTVTPGGGSLFYSVIDMSLNGGNGAVTATKAVLLGAAGSASEALNAVPNADGTGFYVLTSTVGSPNVLAYEFDGAGPVTGTAIVSVMSNNNPDGFGTITLSPDLSQVLLMVGGRLRVLDLDASTGQLTQRFGFDPGVGGSPYSADYSPSGDYIYYSTIFSGAKIVRYKLAGAGSSAEVMASGVNLGAALGSGGGMRRGPDGNMYGANVNTAFLGVVSQPDDPVSPMYVNNGFPLIAGSQSRFNLPTFVTGCPVTAVADLGITKSASSPALPGTTITWTIKVQNFGPDDSSGYTVVDLVPPSITNVASTTPGCTVVGNTVTCIGDTLPDGGIDTIIITGKAPTNAAQSVGNTVTLTGNDNDPTPDNNSSTSTSTVDYPAGLCRGTPLRLLGLLDLATSNLPTTPCATGANILVNVNQPIGTPPGILGPVTAPVGGLLGGLLAPISSSVKAGVISSTSTRGFGLAAATAYIAKVDVVAVGLVTLSVTGVESEAKSQAVAGCGTAVLTGKSKIAAIKLNNIPLVVLDNVPVTVPLLVGGLYINQKVVSGSTITQRALFLDLPGTLLDVVIGETTAGIGC
ncbi:MAG: DUF642 domain-containing protein [Panacagrimonas sp.]